MARNRFPSIAFAAVLLAAAGSAARADEQQKIFSGPQKGEKLPPLKVKGVYDREAGKQLDYVKLAGGKPTVLIFLHKRTRPAAAVIRAVMRFCAGTKQPDNLFAAAVMLTDDATKTENWLKIPNVRKAVGGGGKNVHVGISPDGQEGPGAYGLNRNVTLTILVASKGKVTANFALVQPGAQADVLKVVKQIVAITGDKMPKLADLVPMRYAGKKKGKRRRKKRPAGRPIDGELAGLLRAVIQKDNKPADVDKAVKKLEAYLKKKPQAKQQVGDIARRIINAGRLEMYGTPRAREYMKKWAKEYGKPRKKPKTKD